MESVNWTPIISPKRPQNTNDGAFTIFYTQSVEKATHSHVPTIHRRRKLPYLLIVQICNNSKKKYCPFCTL